MIWGYPHFWKHPSWYIHNFPPPLAPSHRFCIVSASLSFGLHRKELLPVSKASWYSFLGGDKKRQCLKVPDLPRKKWFWICMLWHVVISASAHPSQQTLQDGKCIHFNFELKILKQGGDCYIPLWQSQKIQVDPIINDFSTQFPTIIFIPSWLPHRWTQTPWEPQFRPPQSEALSKWHTTCRIISTWRNVHVSHETNPHNWVV